MWLSYKELSVAATQNVNNFLVSLEQEDLVPSPHFDLEDRHATFVRLCESLSEKDDVRREIISWCDKVLVKQ